MILFEIMGAVAVRVAIGVMEIIAAMSRIVTIMVSVVVRIPVMRVFVVNVSVVDVFVVEVFVMKVSVVVFRMMGVTMVFGLH